MVKSSRPRGFRRGDGGAGFAHHSIGNASEATKYKYVQAICQRYVCWRAVLVFLGFSPEADVVAHLGGFVTGLLLVHFWRWHRVSTTGRWSISLPEFCSRPLSSCLGGGASPIKAFIFLLNGTDNQ